MKRSKGAFGERALFHARRTSVSYYATFELSSSLSCACVCTHHFPPFIFGDSVVSVKMCNDIARVRRMWMRRSKSKVIFLDETKISVREHRQRTLVAPGEHPYIVVEDSSAYAAKYDMIACCSADRVFPPMVYSPEDR